MSKIASTTKVPTSVETFSNLNLDCTHVTTSNWFDLSVAKFMEMPPKSGIDISQSTLARLEPIVAPTYGRGTIYNRAFFVPYRTICPYWDDFYNETPHLFNSNNSLEYSNSYQIPTETPQFYNRTFVEFFNSSKCSTRVTEFPVSSVTHNTTISDLAAGYSYDFISYSDDDGEYILRKFTTFGKKAFNILTQLGYKILFYDNVVIANDITHCALPLLSLCKVYLDWFYPQHYIQDDRYLTINTMLEYNNLDFADNFISGQNIDDIFNVILTTNYDSDFYTSIWDNPNTPNTGASLSTVIPVPVDASGAENMSSSHIQYNGDSDPQLIGGPSGDVGFAHITKLGLSMLSKFSDFLKRNQLAGSRAIDRYLARFGVKLPAEALKRSLHLNSNKQPVIFGDVTSTADTDGAYLGQYGGKGVSFSDELSPVNYETNEYGMFLIVNTIVPDCGYYQGADMSTTRKQRIEYYDGTFDNLGTEAISLRNVYVPEDYSLYHDSDDGIPAEPLKVSEKVFGFSPRFWSYKIPRDVLSGDFVVKSIGVGKDAWHLFRNLDSLYGSKGIYDMTHNISLVNAGDRQQYNRIFFIENFDVDHFNIVHNFRIKFRYPGHSLYESIDFDNNDKSDKSTIDVGATKMN